jgi:hypothetical protein
LQQLLKTPPTASQNPANSFSKPRSSFSARKLVNHRSLQKKEIQTKRNGREIEHKKLKHKHFTNLAGFESGHAATVLRIPLEAPGVAVRATAEGRVGVCFGAKGRTEEGLQKRKGVRGEERKVRKVMKEEKGRS